MRDLAINKQLIYYRNTLTDTALTNELGQLTGEYGKQRGTLTALEISITPATGSSMTEIFGNFTAYDKVMFTCDKTLDINESTVLWVDDLNLMHPSDYKIVKIASSLNGTSYAIRKER